jgi:hypothetical protein
MKAAFLIIALRRVGWRPPQISAIAALKSLLRQQERFAFHARWIGATAVASASAVA